MSTVLLLRQRYVNLQVRENAQVSAVQHDHLVQLGEGKVVDGADIEQFRHVPDTWRKTNHFWD